MDKLKNISIVAIKNSRWIKCNRVTYIENGKEKEIFIPQSHNSCAILVHNTERNVFILVKQFRAAAYFNEIGLTQSKDQIIDPVQIDPNIHNPASGITLELCAGLIDHSDKTIRGHAVMELYEELGLKVEENECVPIITHKVNSCQTMFYTQVTDANKIGKGGGAENENELIESFEVDVKNALEFIRSSQVIKPAGLTFAFLWFLAFKMDGNKGYLGNLTDVPQINLNNYKSLSFDTKVTNVEEDAGCGSLVLSQATYTQSEKEIKWDLLHSENSFALLLHDVENDCFLLHRRFKIGTYLSQARLNKESCKETLLLDGVSIDLVRENILKGQKPFDAAKEFLTNSKLDFELSESLCCCRTNSGISGTRVSFFYVKVKNVNKFSHKLTGDIVKVPVSHGISFALQFQEKSSITSMALLWYYVVCKLNRDLL